MLIKILLLSVETKFLKFLLSGFTGTNSSLFNYLLLGQPQDAVPLFLRKTPQELPATESSNNKNIICFIFRFIISDLKILLYSLISENTLLAG